MIKEEKRRQHNIANMVRFFMSPIRSGSPWTRIKSMENLSPTQIVSFLHWYDKYSYEIDYLIDYYRRFKVASREITEADVAEAKKLIEVKNVIES